MNEEQVTFFDINEANAEKAAKLYGDTSYDNSTASNGALGKLDEIKEKVSSITTNVGDLTQAYKDLEGMYNEFTHFNELMDSNIYRFETAISNIELRFNELKTAIEDRVNDQVKADQELMEDIEGNTNEMETGESTPEGSETPVEPAAETDPSSTPTAEDQTPTSEEPTTPTDPQESSKSPSDIADEVIQGKWGSGDERKKALEDAGYNSDEIQDIVNKKMNGTYTGDSTSGGNGGAPTPTDTPTGGDTGTNSPTGGNTNPTSGGGQESPLSPGETPAPEPTSPTFRSEGNMGLVNAAKDYVGTPYVYGGTNKGGIDCSALVQNAARANGIELPRTTGELAKVGVQVSPNDIRPGDVLFTNGGKHVVIVSNVGPNGEITVISASSYAGKVVEEPLPGSYIQARRYW